MIYWHEYWSKGKSKRWKTFWKIRNYLVFEPNYQTTKFFKKNLLAIEIKNKEIRMNKPVYLGRLILELSKILMYDFWYDYVSLYT